MTFISEKDVERLRHIDGKIILQPIPWWINVAVLLAAMLLIGMCAFALRLETSPTRAVFRYLVPKPMPQNGVKKSGASGLERGVNW